MSSGKAVFSTSTLATGPHTLHAAYAGYATHSASASDPVPVTVSLSTPGITLGSSLNPSSSGQPVTFTATLTGPKSASLPTGTVTFSNGSSTLGTPVTVSQGKATISLSNLPVGNLTISASYSGDPNYTSAASQPLSQVVLGAKTTTVLTSDTNPSTYGQAVTFHVAVSSAGGTPSGTVNLTDGGTLLSTLTLNNGGGQAAVSSLTAGTHRITATYAGSTIFAASANSLTQQVNTAGTKTLFSATPATTQPNQAVSLSVTVQGSSPTGTIQILEKGKVIVSGALAGGTFAQPITTLAIGSHTLIATYSGDLDNAASTSTAVQVTVNKAAAPQVSLSSSQNPSTLNQGVTFSVVVSGTNGIPTGTATLFDGSARVSPAQTLANSATAFNVGTLAAGTHQLTVHYSGDATYAEATSLPLTQVVNAGIAVKLQLSSSANPAAQGFSILFTETVLGVDGSLATGSITLSEDSTTYGSATLIKGRGLISTDQIPVGAHELRMTYGGDATHLAATSAPFQQIVTAPTR